MRTLASFVVILSCSFASLAAQTVDPARNAFVATMDPLGEPVTSVAYLDQNWSPSQSVQFYFTSQGAQILPYGWFLALEQADSTTLFRDNQNMLRYRYLAQNAGPRNPDGLAVGFVAGSGTGRSWLGMTCAACHTAEVRYGTTAYRIDGGPTGGDVQAFLTDLIRSLQQTQTDPAKFGRFAASVLGPINSAANQVELKAQLGVVIKARVGYNLRNFPGYDPANQAAANPSRYARLDAVGAIINEVFYHAVRAADLTSPTVVAKLANAPVSYPFLWDTPQHDVVQWLGIAKNGGPLDIFTLSRNVGEVLGVFADFAIPEEPTLLNLGYSSSVKLADLVVLEELLKSLWSPQWPADFPKIDTAAAAKGAQLYQASCVSCHALIDRTDPNRKITAVMNDSGTDPGSADNFFTRTGPSGKLTGVNVNFVPFTAKIPAVASADVMLTNEVTGVILGGFKQAPPDELRQLSFRPAPAAGTQPAVVRAGSQVQGAPAQRHLGNGPLPA